MNYSLSFCDIAQISDTLFEVIDKEGVIIDKRCANEVANFWTNLRQEPFGLLVNCQNSFSLSFEGGREIGIHPLQHKTAILIHDNEQELSIQSAMGIKKALNISYQHKIFYDRKKALEWLRNSNVQ